MKLSERRLLLMNFLKQKIIVSELSWRKKSSLMAIFKKESALITFLKEKMIVDDSVTVEIVENVSKSKNCHR